MSATPGPKQVFRSPLALARVERGVQFLLSCGRATTVVIMAPSFDAAAQVAERAGTLAGGSFGWHRFTLARLAGVLAAPTLGERGAIPVGQLPREAICARIVHRLGPAGLGRFAAIADRPGLPRALARTLDELRMAGIAARELPDRDIGRLLEAYEEDLARANLVDCAEVLRIATRIVLSGARADFRRGTAAPARCPTRD